MEGSTLNLGQLAMSSKQFTQRLVTIGENRIELLTVEVQEEREHLLRAFLLSLGMASFGFLAGLTLTAAIVVSLWAYSPVIVLLILTCLYVAAGIFLGCRLASLLHDWKTLSATLDQLRKDLVCLKKLLA